MRSRVMRVLRPHLDRRPAIKAVLKDYDLKLSRAQHSIARWVPSVIRPEPRQLTIAVTAHCNLRCLGCGYGRDFMRGHSLSLQLTREILQDARQAGINKVKFYGGEPLLHRDLPAMIAHAVQLGLDVYVNTNGTLLRHKIDDLYASGLRLLAVGFYGSGAEHGVYTQRGDSFRRLEAGIKTVREKYYDEVELQLNFVVMAHTCTVAAARAAWDFAKHYNMFFHVDLVNPNIPFFNPSRGGLEINQHHKPQVIEMTEELLRLKKKEPARFVDPIEFLRSIPDWLLKGPDMRVPCDAYQLVWIGADGTVQLCDTALPIGNIRERPLREILFSEAHEKAARDAFCLNCPQCLCKIESRILKDAPSMYRYRRELPLVLHE
jgi:MoaA/NifB/PqqE/SkfB family radical SAM enzyme